MPEENTTQPDKIKKMIMLAVPMSICNFRCSYCYLTHRTEYYQNKQPEFKYSPEHVAKALSKERLGGLAFINICADGETLLTNNIAEYVYHLLKEGHYIEFVTNLSVTPVLTTMLSWDKELLKRLEFKCSFHYMQLKQKNLLSRFASNVQRIWDAGASATIETTPHDELIPYLDEMKEFSMKHFGALPHITIARRDDTEGIEYLTDLSMDQYDRVWGSFDSDFWKFKKTLFMKKRKEYCYAGDWLLNVNLETGIAKQCYRSYTSQNIFDDLSVPIKFNAIGKCREAHCYNGHAMISFGAIPRLTHYQFGNLRNRVREDGTEWLQPELKHFFNTKLTDNNQEYSALKKLFTYRYNPIRFKAVKFKNTLKHSLKSLIKNTLHRK